MDGLVAAAAAAQATSGGDGGSSSSSSSNGALPRVVPRYYDLRAAGDGSCMFTAFAVATMIHKLLKTPPLPPQGADADACIGAPPPPPLTLLDGDSAQAVSCGQLLRRVAVRWLQDLEAPVYYGGDGGTRGELIDLQLLGDGHASPSDPPPPSMTTTMDATMLPTHAQQGETPPLPSPPSPSQQEQEQQQRRQQEEQQQRRQQEEQQQRRQQEQEQEQQQRRQQDEQQQRRQYYLAIMAQPRTWGGSAEYTALARALNYAVEVYTLRAGHPLRLTDTVPPREDVDAKALCAEPRSRRHPPPLEGVAHTVRLLIHVDRSGGGEHYSVLLTAEEHATLVGVHGAAALAHARPLWGV